MEDKIKQMRLNFEAIESPSPPERPTINEDKNTTKIDFSFNERLAARKKEAERNIYKNVLSLVKHLY